MAGVSSGTRGMALREEEVVVRWLPSLVVLAMVVLVAPVWPWNRGWGWTPAGMVAVILATVLLFTLSTAPA